MAVNRAGRKASINIWNRDGNVYLLTFTHPARVTKRLALTQDRIFTSAGIDYQGWPFELYLPGSDEDVPRGSLTISNVTNDALKFCAPLKYPPPKVQIQRVVESDPDTAQETYKGLYFRRVRGVAASIEVFFGQQAYAAEPYPAGRMTSRVAPWLEIIG